MYTYEQNYLRICLANGNRLNYNRFLMIEDDGDYNVSVRVFSGRMTKGRWKVISHFCRLHSFTDRSYSDYDCTGRMVGHYLSFSYQTNQVIITLRRTYDL